MFITKTINESAANNINIEHFDIVDSICEAYEDLLSFNETLAHFDIKEQELIHTESADLDAFREDAMEKAKKLLNKFIAKLKAKWSKFVIFINRQIIKYFDDSINSFIKNNTEMVNELNNLIKKAYAKGSDDLYNYFSLYVVKGNNVVDLINFVADLNLTVYRISNFKAILGLSEEKIKKEMERNIPKEFTDDIKHEVGEFVNTRDIKPDRLPLFSIEDFKKVSEMMHGLIDKSDGIFEMKIKNIETGIELKDKVGPEISHRYYNWMYINLFKIYNIYISMCRKYFVSLVSAVKRIANDVKSEK